MGLNLQWDVEQVWWPESVWTTWGVIMKYSYDQRASPASLFQLSRSGPQDSYMSMIVLYHCPPWWNLWVGQSKTERRIHEKLHCIKILYVLWKLLQHKHSTDKISKRSPVLWLHGADLDFMKPVVSAVHCNSSFHLSFLSLVLVFVWCVAWGRGMLW